MVKTRSQGGGDQEGDHQEDLALQVSVLQQQMTSMMEMMSNMMNKQAEENRTREETPGVGAGSGHRQESRSNLDEEEEEAIPSFQHHQDTSGKVMPFKVEAKIDIPSYDGTIDARQLDSWLDQLETYFTIYGYSSQEKVIFARLKLTHHALVWWNAHLKHEQQNIGWNQFKKLIRQEFYPMGYEEDRWTEWHGLRQGQGQSVQEFTTDFRRQALMMGLPLEEKSMITKYVAGLHILISNELRLFPVNNFCQASGMAMAIERKNKDGRSILSTGQRSQQAENTGISKNKNNKWKEQDSAPSSTSQKQNNGLYCDHCKLSNHSKDRCWKLHPELYPEKFKKTEGKGKRVAVAVDSDQEDRTLTTFNEADPSLSLMVGTSRIPIRESDPREELFTLRVQVKQELVDAIIDPGSITNLISADLVNRLGLETTAHPRPHILGWIQGTNTGIQVNQQCRLRFAISRDYIDEITCDVVPLEICQVLLGSPYLWDRDAIFYRRAQQYRLTKDGVNSIVNRVKTKLSDETVTGSVSRTIHSSRHVLLANHHDTKTNNPQKPGAGRIVQMFSQYSKNKVQQRTPQEEELVTKIASQEQGDLQNQRVVIDGHSRVSKVPAQLRGKSVCTDGRLMTAAEKKKKNKKIWVQKNNSVCIDGRLKSTCVIQQNIPVCIDGESGNKKKEKKKAGCGRRRSRKENPEVARQSTKSTSTT